MRKEIIEIKILYILMYVYEIFVIFFSSCRRSKILLIEAGSSFPITFELTGV